MRKIFKLNTITKKVILCILCIALAGVIAIKIWLPGLLYTIMKPQITDYMKNMINAYSVRQSYVWQKKFTAFTIYHDDEVYELLREYYAPEYPNKKEIREKLNIKMPKQQAGMKAFKMNRATIYFESFTMILTDRNDVFCIGEAKERGKTILNSEWFKSLVETDETAYYSPAIYNDKLINFEGLICFVKPFEVENIKCYALSTLDLTYILHQFEQLESMGIHDYEIISGGQVLYRSSDYDYNMDIYPQYMFESIQHEPVMTEVDDGMDFSVLCSYSNEDFRTFIHIDRETLIAPYEKVFSIIQFVLYIIVAALVVCIIIILRSMLVRITKLNKKMAAVKGGDYNVVLEDFSKDEVGELAQMFDMMIRTIKKDIRQRLESEKKEQKMQYSLLVSAIDPHFIYNTLNTITFLAKMGKNEEITEVNKALIGTLKDRLNIQNCKTFDTVKAEKEILEQYMIIQNYLCHIKINYTFAVKDEDLKLEIPKNILQPIVENSIKHGLLPHKNTETMDIVEGEINVSVERVSDKIKISITDNGIGMSQEQIREFFDRDLKFITENESEHVGIYNIRMRLSYLFEDRYTMSVISEAGKGTTVFLLLPLLE